MLVANDRKHLVGCDANVTDRRPNASLIAVLLAAIVVSGSHISYSTFRTR